MAKKLDLLPALLMGLGSGLTGTDYLGAYMENINLAERMEQERLDKMAEKYIDYMLDAKYQGDEVMPYEDFKRFYTTAGKAIDDDLDDKEKAELKKTNPDLYKKIYGGDGVPETTVQQPIAQPLSETGGKHAKRVKELPREIAGKAKEAYGGYRDYMSGALTEFGVPQSLIEGVPLNKESLPLDNPYFNEFLNRAGSFHDAIRQKAQGAGTTLADYVQNFMGRFSR